MYREQSDDLARWAQRVETRDHMRNRLTAARQQRDMLQREYERRRGSHTLPRRTWPLMGWMFRRPPSPDAQVQGALNALEGRIDAIESDIDRLCSDIDALGDVDGGYQRAIMMAALRLPAAPSPVQERVAAAQHELDARKAYRTSIVAALRASQEALRQLATSVRLFGGSIGSAPEGNAAQIAADATRQCILQCIAQLRAQLWAADQACANSARRVVEALQAA